MTDLPVPPLPPEPEGMSLNDFLVMRTGLGDETSKLAGLILRGGLGSVQLTSRWSRDGLRKLCDELDERDDVHEPWGGMVGRGVLGRYEDALRQGTVNPRLASELLETLKTSVRFARAVQEAAEGLDDPRWGQVRSHADFLRFALDAQ